MDVRDLENQSGQQVKLLFLPYLGTFQRVTCAKLTEDAELDSTGLAAADVNTTTDDSITLTAKFSGEAFWLHRT